MDKVIEKKVLKGFIWKPNEFDSSYICINQVKSYSEKEIIRINYFNDKDLSRKEIKDNFAEIRFDHFAIRWRIKIIKKKLLFQFEEEINDYERIELTELGSNIGTLFFQEVAFYLYKLERIDESLLVYFYSTIKDTLEELKMLLRQKVSEEKIKEIILKTGEVFKEMYESFSNLNNDNEFIDKIIRAYYKNLELRKNLFVDLNSVQNVTTKITKY